MSDLGDLQQCDVKNSPVCHGIVDRVDKKTFVNLTGAQLLGAAVSPGAVYVASVLEHSTEILCIKGNDRLKSPQTSAVGPLSRYTEMIGTS